VGRQIEPWRCVCVRWGAHTPVYTQMDDDNEPTEEEWALYAAWHQLERSEEVMRWRQLSGERRAIEEELANLARQSSLLRQELEVL